MHEELYKNCVCFTKVKSEDVKTCSMLTEATVKGEVIVYFCGSMKMPNLLCLSHGFHAMMQI